MYGNVLKVVDLQFIISNGLGFYKLNTRQVLQKDAWWLRGKKMMWENFIGWFISEGIIQGFILSTTKPRGQMKQIAGINNWNENDQVNFWMLSLVTWLSTEEQRNSEGEVNLSFYLKQIYGNQYSDPVYSKQSNVSLKMKYLATGHVPYTLCVPNVPSAPYVLCFIGSQIHSIHNNNYLISIHPN